MANWFDRGRMHAGKFQKFHCGEQFKALGLSTQHFFGF